MSVYPRIHLESLLSVLECWHLSVKNIDGTKRASDWGGRGSSFPGSHTYTVTEDQSVHSLVTFALDCHNKLN